MMTKNFSKKKYRSNQNSLLSVCTFTTVGFPIPIAHCKVIRNGEHYKTSIISLLKSVLWKYRTRDRDNYTLGYGTGNVRDTISYLLKEGKVETLDQVSVLHVTAEILGLLDHLSSPLCRVVILARIRSHRPEQEKKIRVRNSLEHVSVSA